MIIIVPKWMESRISRDVIAYCWLYIIVQKDGRGFVYKDRLYQSQRFISKEEINELVKEHIESQLYQTLCDHEAQFGGQQ